MKTRYSSLIRGLVCAASLAWIGSLAAADNWTRYEAQPGLGSKVKIDGTSTVHDWTVESQMIAGFMEFDTSFPTDPGSVVKVKPKVEVSIPVRQIKSGKKSMDNIMHEAMKQKDHPKVEYRLLAMTPKDVSKKPDGPFQFDAKGTLTVAGVTRTNTMPVTLQRFEQGKLRVIGTTAVKMTDFGIKPPAPDLALGLIKTGDDVKITFEWITAQKVEAAKTP